MNPKRDEWVDITKGIGILLIALGHTMFPLNNIIYVFHVPLFFIVSGYLLNYDKWQGKNKEFAISRFKRMMIPYFGSCALFYPYWIFIGSKFDESFEEVVPIIKPLIGIFYGNGIDDWLAFYIPLWFLPCLFIAELIFINLLNVGSRSNSKLFAVVSGAALLGYLISQYIFLPWSLDVALVAQPFMLLGSRLRKMNVLHKLSNLSTLLLSIGAILLFSISVYINVEVDMNWRDYKNILLFYAGGVSGSFLVFAVSRLLAKSQIIKKVLIKLGSETLIILTLHGLPYKAVSAIAVFLFHYELKTAHQELWPIYFVVSILFPIFVTWIAGNTPLIKRIYYSA